MNGNIEIKYEKYKLENYIIDILAIGTCKLFFPAAFIIEEEEVISSYRADGFRRLSSFAHIATEDMLNLIISLMEGIRDAQRHYIFAEEFEVNMEYIFVGSQFHDVKMIFLPAKEELSLEDKVISLLEKLEAVVSEEGLPYIEDAIAFVRKETLGYQGIIHHLESLRKEVYLCNIK